MTDDNRTYLWNKRFAVLHQALANKLYHQSCAAIFERRDRFSKLVSMIGASAVFISLASADVARAWAMIGFSGAAASLVFRWSEKSRYATEKMLMYAGIVADINRVGERDFTEPQINDWAAQLSAITEPAPNAALWGRVCDASAVALGSKPEKRSWFERHLPAIMIP